MLGYFEQLTQIIDKHSTEMESKNNLIRSLKEKQMNHETELKSKSEQLQQLEKATFYLQMQIEIYRSKEDLMPTVLEELEKMHKLIIEQLRKN